MTINKDFRYYSIAKVIAWQWDGSDKIDFEQVPSIFLKKEIFKDATISKSIFNEKDKSLYLNYNDKVYSVEVGGYIVCDIEKNYITTWTKKVLKIPTYPTA